MYLISGEPQRRIIFVGNSIFNKDGTNAIEQKYISQSIRTALNALGLHYPVFDYSISGQSTTTMISNFSLISPMIRKGDIVVCTEATNDAGVNLATALQCKTNILTYRDLVWALGAKFVLQGAIACNSGTLPAYANLTTTLQAYNDYFRITPSLVDAFSDPGALTQCDVDADCASATYFNVDGIHPKTVLQDLIYPLTQAAIQTLL